MTDEEYQALILSEMGLSNDTDILTNISSWWALHADKSTKNLQYLYTKRQIWEFLIGKYREAMDSQVGPDSFKLNQLFQNAMAGYKLATTAIGEETQGTLGPGIVSSISSREAFEHPYARERTGRSTRCSRRR